MKNQRIVALRKKELLDTAKSLFLTNGVDATTVNDIVEKMGVAKGTFYHYFASKEHLVEEVLMTEINALADEIKKVATDKNTDYCERMKKIMQLVDINYNKFDITSVKNLENKNYYERYLMRVISKRINLFEDFFKEGKRLGLINIKHTKEVTLLVLLGVINLNKMTPVEDRDAITASTFFGAVEDVFSMPEGSLTTKR